MGGKGSKLSAKQILEKKLERAAKSGVLSLAGTLKSAHRKGKNKQIELPPQLLQLTKLRSLDVSGNDLADVTPLHAFGNLQKLDLSKNNLTAKGLCRIDGHRRLTDLNLSSNPALQLIPFKMTPSLKRLNLSKCNFAAVPPSLLHLGTLEVLDISGNVLTSLPLWVDDDGSPAPICDKLKDLNLSDNHISSLEQHWQHFRVLHTLNLNHNRLTSVSSSLLADSPVVHLSLTGNHPSLTKEVLTNLPGFERFEVRRRNNLNKGIHGGLVVDTSLCGLD